MCEGTDADKGVLAQKTELPGIYPGLLAPLMMMTVLKMMTMAMMMMTMLMMNLHECVKIMKQYSMLFKVSDSELVRSTPMISGYYAK